MRSALALLLLFAATVLIACGGAEDDRPAATDGNGPTTTATPPARPGAIRTPRARRPRLVRARCPAGVAGCAAVTGRVLYVEAVDPDGDGDAHYVLLGGDVTAPGMTAVDVAPELRPRRLPRVGERVSAAGPVQTGSYGQSQIHALVLHHERAR